MYPSDDDGTSCNVTVQQDNPSLSSQPIVSGKPPYTMIALEHFDSRCYPRFCPNTQIYSQYVVLCRVVAYRTWFPLPLDYNLYRHFFGFENPYFCLQNLPHLPSFSISHLLESLMICAPCSMPTASAVKRLGS